MLTDVLLVCYLLLTVTSVMLTFVKIITPKLDDLLSITDRHIISMLFITDLGSILVNIM